MSFEGIPYFDSQNSNVIPFPNIRPPFPPTFITAFTNNLTSLNYKLTMIDVSRLVSNFWKHETKEVKDAYAEIAKKIDVELKEKRKHDKKCPVIWKIDKKSKKQKRGSRRNSKNNDSTNNSSTKFRNTTEIAFESPNYSIPINEPNRSSGEMSSQTSLQNSPISASPLIGFPGIIPAGYDVMNYDNSYESQSNESEEETYDLYNLCDQNLNPIYNSSAGFSNFVYENIYVPYNWNMNDPCINNGNGNLACQQGNEFH
ncbi:hypothetical protein RhiirC2_740302 [Rhizophagus irregularis]|uniref:MATA-HMG n=1 Tax=Rhizophagus irregularis TaxID=588596 RepID=A0A2N1NIH5_9GLOM|nr:hypothetical protein RhiirC2_740302 [Rhizophagus irregularis]